MNTKEQVEQDLYDILAEILNRMQRQKNLKLIKKQQNIKESSPSEGTTKRSSYMQLLTTKKNTLNKLLITKQNLNSIKEKLQKDPQRYRKELNRIEKVEQKLDNGVRKEERKTIILALNTLKNNPKRYILKLIDSRIRIENLKKKLKENPLKYEAEMRKLIQLEKKLNQSIENAKSKMLNKVVFYGAKHPEKFRKEINRYNQMEKKLKEYLLKPENKRDVNKNKVTEKIRYSKEKISKKELELSR